MKKFTFIFILLPLYIFSSSKTLDDFKKGSSFFNIGKYKEALDIFESINKELITIKKPSFIEKTIFDITEDIIKDIKFLIGIKDTGITNIIKEAYKLENHNKKDSLLKYIEARIVAHEKSLDMVKYIEEIKTGNLENFITEKIKNLDNSLSSDFLKKIQEEKSRKKSLTFYQMERDPKSDPTFQKVFLDNLMNYIERSDKIEIIDKVFAGDKEKIFADLKEKNIDFILTGYYKEEKNKLNVNFQIYDTYNNKKLVDATIIMPFTKEFFYRLDDALKIIEEALVDYSRLEDSKTLVITGDEKRIKKFEEKEENSLIKYLDDKINNIVSNIVNDSYSLTDYEQITSSIEQYNNVSSTKIKIEEIKYYEISINNRIEKETGFDKVREYSKKEDYDNFYKSFNNFENKIIEAKVKYKSLSSFIEKFYSIALNEKSSIDKTVANLKKEIISRMGFVVRINDLLRNDFLYPDIKHNLFYRGGLVYEKNADSDFWIILDLTVGGSTILITSIITEKNSIYTQPLIGIDAGFKYYIIDKLYLLSLISLTYPIKIKDTVRLKGINTVYSIGIGYNFNSFGIEGYGNYNINNFEYVDDYGFSSYYNNRFGIGIAMNYYFNKEVKYYQDKEKEGDILIGINTRYSRSEIYNSSAIQSGIINFFSFGFILGYRKDIEIGAGIIEYAFGFDNGFNLNNKGFLGLGLEPYIKGNFFNLFGINLYGAFSLSLSVFNSKVLENYAITYGITIDNSLKELYNDFSFYIILMPVIGFEYNFNEYSIRLSIGKDIPFITDGVRSIYNVSLSFIIKM